MKLTPREKWLMLKAFREPDYHAHFDHWLKENESRLAEEAPSDNQFTIKEVFKIEPPEVDHGD